MNHDKFLYLNRGFREKVAFFQFSVICFNHQFDYYECKMILNHKLNLDRYTNEYRNNTDKQNQLKTHLLFGRFMQKTIIQPTRFPWYILRFFLGFQFSTKLIFKCATQSTLLLDLYSTCVYKFGFEGVRWWLRRCWDSLIFERSWFCGMNEKILELLHIFSNMKTKMNARHPL